MTKTIMEVVNQCPLTHTELAEKTGLTYPTIHEIGMGLRPVVRDRTIKVIADALGMDVSQIRQTGKVDMRSTKDSYNTLCWSCIHAVPSQGYGCEWSRHGKPVDGWTAEESEISTWVKSTDKSYSVKACPQYEPDDGEQRLIDDETPMRTLGVEIIKRAAQDYVTELEKEKKRREMDAALLLKRRMYKSKYPNLYGYDNTDGELKKLEHFFKSQYAEGLSDLNCKYIQRKIKQECGL